MIRWRLSLAGHVAYTREMTSVERILAEKPEAERSLGRYKEQTRR
jgi:hypothetical protein